MKKNRLNYFYLVAGIACVAMSLGYMVGGSATPVVGAVIGPIFAMILAALAVLSPAKSATKKKKDDEESSDNDIALSFEQLQKIKFDALGRFGIVLMVFTLFYIPGTVTGSLARTHLWFAPERQFPWMTDAMPQSIPAALELIKMQEQLRSMGYEYAQIHELYDRYDLKTGQLDDNRSIERSRSASRMSQQGQITLIGNLQSVIEEMGQEVLPATGERFAERSEADQRYAIYDRLGDVLDELRELDRKMPEGVYWPPVGGSMSTYPAGSADEWVNKLGQITTSNPAIPYDPFQSRNPMSGGFGRGVLDEGSIKMLTEIHNSVQSWEFSADVADYIRNSQNQQSGGFEAWKNFDFQYKE